MNRVEPGGVWLSGPGIGPLPPVAPNEADDSPIVDQAVTALEAWGGDGLNRRTVRMLLPFWVRYTDIGPHDFVAIMKRFPGRGDGVPSDNL